MRMHRARTSVNGAATIATIADLGMVYCVVPFSVTDKEDELGSADDSLLAVCVAIAQSAEVENAASLICIKGVSIQCWFVPPASSRESFLVSFLTLRNFDPPRMCGARLYVVALMPIEVSLCAVTIQVWSCAVVRFMSCGTYCALLPTPTSSFFSGPRNEVER